MTEWHLITSEYPPQPGGVADYTHLVARGLAETGDSVWVWCPSATGPTPTVSGVTVRREMGGFLPSDLCRVGDLLDGFKAPRRLLVQWVPHGFGCRAVNLPFCWWLFQRTTRRRDRVELMVHEAFLHFGGSWKQYAAAVVQRLMMVLLLRAARQVWGSMDRWQDFLRPYTLGRRVPFAWLPIPSTVPVVTDSCGIAAVRARYAGSSELLLGHFGTYGPYISHVLTGSLPVVLQQRCDVAVLLLGRGSEQYRGQLLAQFPSLVGRVHATGGLPANRLSLHLSACDVMLQPHPGGANGRSTTIMAALAHSKPVATTFGSLTESVWPESGAVALAPDGDPAVLAERTEALLADGAERLRMGAAATAFYQQYFDIRHTVATLRGEQPKG